jgi:hypothetical protein
VSLLEPSELRAVSGVGPADLVKINSFIQGAVYAWVKNRRDEWFAVRDLVGGENRDWSGTPLQVLYDKHTEQGKDDGSASDAAARDLGWIVKSVLHEDKRTFEVAKAGLVNSYRWTGDEAESSAPAV